MALTVLDFGRTTFGASCTGAAKFCVERAAKHAATRVQFGQPLANFELVKEKLAYMQAGAFAMEAATYQTAALIDSGEGDYMLETAMLKVLPPTCCGGSSTTRSRSSAARPISPTSRTSG